LKEEHCKEGIGVELKFILVYEKLCRRAQQSRLSHLKTEVKPVSEMYRFKKNSDRV
jgi:hypothetical protein